MWHNFTNHPAHQKKPEGDPPTSGSDTGTKDSTKEAEKKDDESKKASGSGSG